jgi:hypothetical protein
LDQLAETDSLAETDGPIDTDRPTATDRPTDTDSAVTPDPSGDDDGATSTPSRWLWGAYCLGAVAALVPVVRMVGVVRDGSALQHNDYWEMFPRFTTSGGGLDLGGLFAFQNHPVVVPQVIYWLNAQLFSGSNIALGFLVVGLALAQLAIIAALLSHSGFGALERVILFVLASALLFNLVGAWNFSKAMSGTAWFTANVFALAAVYLRSRDRTGWAFVLAAVAAVSYGTGIVAWAAVIAAGASMRPWRQWWREWPYAAGLGATALLHRAGTDPPIGISSDVTEIADVVATTLGSVLGLEGTAATSIGAIALVGVPVLALWLALTARGPAVAGWVGLAAFGWVANIQLAVGRHRFVSIFGFQNRYSSLAALTWIGLVALAVLAARKVARDQATRRFRLPSVGVVGAATAGLLALPLLVAALTAGRAHVDEMLVVNNQQELREVALHMRVVDGTPYLSPYLGLPTPEGTEARMIAMGHHPFVDDWDLDCGLLGRQLEVGVPAGNDGDGALRSMDEPSHVTDVVQLMGRAPSDRTVRCLLVIDGDDTVIGAATVGTGPNGNGFRALAHRQEGTYRVVAIVHDPGALEEVVVLDGELTLEDLDDN